MPTYQFRCSEGHDFEKFGKMSDDRSNVVCPHEEYDEDGDGYACGAPATQVFLTAPQISTVACREFNGFDVGLGRGFSSLDERRRYLKQNGLHEWGPEQSEKYDREQRDLKEKEADMEASTYTNATIRPKMPEQIGNFRMTSFKPVGAKNDIMPAEDSGKKIDVSKKRGERAHHPALRPKIARAL